MNIKFTKMHGLGNDFMIIDATTRAMNLSSEQIQWLSNRHTGVGFDQCLLVEASHEEGVDFLYRIFNADGQEVGQCGNGARCLARFVYHYGLTTKKNIMVATYSTTMQLTINEDNTVTVRLEKPKLTPQEIPIIASIEAAFYLLELDNGTSYKLHVINVGNPHAVSLVTDIDDIDVNGLGKQLSEHTFFPEQTNVGFMQVLDSKHIRLRVYERGSKETLACGSAAVAAAAIGKLYYQLSSEIEVQFSCGKLQVYWPDTEGPIYLTGPAQFVYEGLLMLT